MCDGVGGRVDEAHNAALKACADLVAFGQYQDGVVEDVRPVPVLHVSTVYRINNREKLHKVLNLMGKLTAAMEPPEMYRNPQWLRAPQQQALFAASACTF
jgi:hypothetical protein